MRFLLAFMMLLYASCSVAQEPQDILSSLISDKGITDYHSKDFFTCARYENSQMALDDVDPFNLDSKRKRRSWVQKTAIKLDITDKFVLPLMTEQRVEEFRWRKSPEKTVVELLGINREGLNEAFDVGELLKRTFRKKFGDFDINDTCISANKVKIYSPLADAGRQYYGYDIDIIGDSAAKIIFIPTDTCQNLLTGEILAVKDSIWRVKMYRASLPAESLDKRLSTLHILQEFGLTEDGMWMLRKSEYIVELKASGILGKLCFIKKAAYNHFSTAPITCKSFRGRSKYRYNKFSEYRTSQFWAQFDDDLSASLRLQHEQDSLRGTANVQASMRVVQHSESYSQRRINDILKYIQRTKYVGFIAYPLRALINDYISLGNPEVFNIEPVTSLVSFNDIDNLRLRFGGNTTANFNHHIFLGGYVAYGFGQKNVYYNAVGTYSFKKNNYNADEFPRRYVRIRSRFDVGYLGERTNHVDHDNIFKSYHWDKLAEMMFYHEQKIEVARDEHNGIGASLSFKHEEDQATGGLVFHPMDYVAPIYNGYSTGTYYGTMDNGTIRTTEIRLELSYCPRNSRYFSRKTILPVNSEPPSIGLSHTIGVKAFGGDYSYHLTEMKVVKKWFLGNLGIGKTMLKAGAVWSAVPYPLLLAPQANISYISDDESFSLISASEFVNDKYAQLMLSWETNGNVIGLIPLIKKLRWKEYIAVRMLWGGLSDKNNPYIEENLHSHLLMPIPLNVHYMDAGRPYVEGVLGIHNIFRCLDIDYIYRFTYRNLRDINLGGLRFSTHFNF